MSEPRILAEPAVSIVVCTRDRAPLLDACLASLLDDVSVAEREVIVVSDGSRDGTAAVVRGWQARFEPGRLVLLDEAAAGKSAALNRGLAVARGAFLVFTDDDVTVAAGWTAALVAPFADPDIAAVGGRTLPAWSVPLPSWLDAHLARDLGVRDLGDVARRVAPEDVIGANWALRASLLEGVARPFDPRLGPAGRLKVDYEEFDLLHRLGVVERVAYAPDAVVHHHVDAARVDWGFMRRTYFQRGFGKARHARRRGEPSWGVRTRFRRARLSVAAARKARRANNGLAASSPAAARREFDLYLAAGYDLDMLLQRVPRLADWAAATLA